MGTITLKDSLKELKNVSFIAAPMVGVTVLQYLLNVVSIIMVGHLDDLSLSGVSIAVSYTTVTGQSLLFGMAGGLETLCGQAYGAEQYQKIGTYTYCAIFCMIMVCVPVSVLWMFTGNILALLGQDHSIAQVAHKYSITLIPSLFAFAILQALTRYFQTQSLIFPMFFSSAATLAFHVAVSWVLVFKANMGSTGAALAMGVSFWFNVLFLGLYMKFSSRCQKTRSLSKKDVFLSIKEFYRFAVPSAAMTCLEWWSYDILILLSGLLPNPKIETSVISICFSITYLHYFIPYGIGATASTRISNELGAENPYAAKAALRAIMVLTITEVVVVSATLFSCRNIFGYAFSSDKEIVKRVADMAPFMCLSMVMDSFQSVFSGIARGSGWQNLGAFVNLGAYYLVGTPVGVVLAFVAHLGVKGLLIGLATGSCVQASLLAVRTVFANWQKQALMARERIFDS